MLFVAYVRGINGYYAKFNYVDYAKFHKKVFGDCETLNWILAPRLLPYINKL